MQGFNCIICKNEIPPNAACYWFGENIGCAHIVCAETETEFVELEYDGSRCIVKPNEVKDMTKNDEGIVYNIKPVKMTWGKYHSLPEFKGF